MVQQSYPPDYAARVLPAIGRIEGVSYQRPEVRRRGVHESRIDWGPGLRLYMAFEGRRAVLLLGGGTSVDSRPISERAQARWADYEKRSNVRKSRSCPSLANSSRSSANAPSADPAFRLAMLQDALMALDVGEAFDAKILLRDFINATVGFSALGEAIGTPPQEPDADARPEGQSKPRCARRRAEELARREGYVVRS